MCSTDSTPIRSARASAATPRPRSRSRCSTPPRRAAASRLWRLLDRAAALHPAPADPDPRRRAPTPRTARRCRTSWSCRCRRPRSPTAWCTSPRSTAPSARCWPRAGPKRGVADEGGHWPEVTDTEDALDVLIAGIERTGLRPGRRHRDLARHRREPVPRSAAATASATITLLERRLDRPARADLPHLPGRHARGSGRRGRHRGDAARRRGVGTRTLVVGDDYLVTNADRIRRPPPTRPSTPC